MTLLQWEKILSCNPELVSNIVFYIKFVQEVKHKNTQSHVTDVTKSVSCDSQSVILLGDETPL